MKVTEIKSELNNLSKVLEEDNSDLFNFKSYDGIMSKLKLVNISKLTPIDRVSIGENNFRLLESIANWDSLVQQLSLRRKLTYY